MVSVIIPVYNEPLGLQHTLKSFIHQDLPVGAFEVIVVDNGSKDKTFQEAEKYQQQYPDLIRALKEDTIQGSYAARNKGLQYAKGDIICFIDADMIVMPDYLSQVVKVFASGQVDYLGCKVELYANKNTLAAKYNQLNGFNVAGYLKQDHFAPTCCLSVKKEVLDIVSRFDYRLESGGDYEFGQRVFKAGLKQEFAEHIVVKHPARWKYSSLVNKSKRIARGIAQLYIYYPSIYKKDFLKYFIKKRHLPKNPLRIYKKSKSRNLPVSVSEAIILSMYHIPISFISTSEAKKAYARLKSEQTQTQ